MPPDRAGKRKREVADRTTILYGPDRESVPMASRLLVGEAAPRVMIRCWGDFAIEDGATGADLRPRGRKARALLAYLVLHPGKAVSRERLAGLLWGDRGEDQARGSLRQTLFELRDLANGGGVMLVDRETVALVPDSVVTDIEAMRALLEAGDFPALLATLPDGDDLLFANLDGIDPGFDEWLQIERTRQRDLLVTLVADASAGALAIGQARAARALHARLLELDPDDRTPAPSEAYILTPTPAPASAVAKPPRKWRAAAFAASVLLSTGAIGGAMWLRAEAPVAPGPDRDVRELYDAAHQIIYQRNGDEFPLATQLLRRALALAPNNVPVMADLAAIIAMSNRTPDGFAEAEGLARRAIQLDPNSAMANGVLGMVLNFDSDEARALVKKAARLDSRDPQIQFWLSNVLGLEGDYVGRLQALRRAAAIDPLWHRATGSAAVAAWEFGYIGEADAYAARLRERDPRLSFLCGYSVDMARGNYARVVRETVAARARLTEADGADFKLGMALLALGYEQPARLLLRLPPPLWRVVSGAGPAPGELEPLLIAATVDDRADAFALTALRQTLKAGRAAEIVAAYDRRVGVLAKFATGHPANVDAITDGLQLALALRAVGRGREADALLGKADAAVRQSFSYGAVPNWMYAGASGVWAAQGRKDEALAALKTAIDRGWQYAPLTPLPDMADIPSFAGLRGDPRFEQLRQRLKDHIRREKQEVGPIPV
jgi:tetratricopeptide (TPR) repeat protein